jgi:hypothetical protein
MKRKNSSLRSFLGRLPCGAIVSGIILGVCGCSPTDLFLPAYKMDQTDSSHPGYRRTTLTSGSTVYENDYTEQSLQLQNTAPTQIVGRLRGWGEKTYIYAVDGQDPKNYIVPVGEMYPDGIHRNTRIPPFDWRSARFQKMGFALPTGPAAHKTTTNSVLIDEVLMVLKEAKTSTPPSYVPGTFTNTTAIFLYSDQLPGLMYCPGVYMDPTGPYYLADNQASRTWYSASPLFSAWVQTPSR